MDFTEGLNIQQQQAVMAGLGPALVLAGPGSGKTRVLTQRIAYLIANMGVRPHSILAVTFTNKAAREMERRVQDLLSGQTRGLTLGTFHGICARILRREAEFLPVDANYVIYDADDQVGLVKQAVKDLNLDDKQYKPHGIHAAISNAKNELKGPDDFPVTSYRDEVTRRIYQRYQALLLASNAVDFDDLLLYTANLMENEPAVRERYARRYEHVLVDEFQDTNMAQYLLLKHLASFHRNIFVVGDIDQSIYRWRGADYRNVQRFEKDYPDAQVILLEQNYRSTQNILDVAMAVIDRNPHRTHKQLFTQRGSGQKIFMHEAYNDTEEALYVVDTIALMVGTQQAEPRDFAVMYRTNAQSRLLEEAFIHANLPYKIVGAQRFYGRREIKDLIAFLRLAHNPNDEISLLRVINVPARGIGSKTIQNLRTLAQREGVASGALLLQLGKPPDSAYADALGTRAVRALADFGGRLARWQAAAAEDPPLLLLDTILEDTGYRDYIDDGTDEGRDRWENVMELRRLAAERSDRSLAIFLEEIALVSDQDTLDNATNVPTLLTLHAAKGLEFPNVMIVGVNDGTLPHNRSFDDPEEMMEERRLFYVGITRARDRLFLIFAQMRSTFGFSDYALPSRFLDDLPENLLEDSRNRGERPALMPRRTTVNESYRWEDNQARQPVRASEPSYSPGMHVLHPAWGEGLVLNTRLQDGDEILDIFFDNNIGLKRVVASLAKLKVVRK